MGVSASGKTTIGKLLASKLSFPFFDADDFHPESNLKKMASGQALDDTDRAGWLKTLNNLAKKEPKAIITCSALKESYRTILRDDMNKEVHFVYLKGSYELIYDRMIEREGHMMPVSLLQSQFDTLEEPNSAITVSIELSPQEITEKIISELIHSL